MYDVDGRAFAVALYLDHGYTYEEIEFLFSDSRKFMGSRPSGGGGESDGPVLSTVKQWVDLYLQHGDVNPRASGADGAPVFNDTEIKMLKQCVDTDPTMMLDELIYHMHFHTGKYVDVGTMCRILHRHGYSHKNVTERMLRGPAFAATLGRQETAFLQFQQRHRVEELVSFDESAAVERKIRRRKGWGAVGDETYTYVPTVLLRNVRFTLAATMTSQGRGLAAVCPGSLDRVRFLHFMERVLQGMNRHWDAQGSRTFLPRSVLVMDNCSTHRCEEFYRLARRFGVKLTFTPPYMPWYQPIENAFSVHKAVMRRENVGDGDPNFWHNLCRNAGYM